jgi:hypothetical protein
VDVEENSKKSKRLWIRNIAMLLVGFFTLLRVSVDEIEVEGC